MHEYGVKALNEITSIRAERALNTSHIHLAMLVQSINNDQIEVLKTGMDDLLGYIAWLSVNKESLLLSNKTNTLPPYMYEWSEGKLMLIYDIVFTPGWERLAREKLFEFILKQRFVAYFKRNRINILKHARKRKRFSEK